jgi:FkbM family methyltransferase
MDQAPFGTYAPNPFDRTVLAATSRLPVGWLGLRSAILLRRAVTMRLAHDGALDVERWGLRMRLHPRDNGCEKNLLFTPQMFEPEELAAIRAVLAGRGGTFLDIGANVGLWSLYAASIAPRATVVAVEPEPGNLARLRFNLAANPDVTVRVVAAALGSASGDLGMVLNNADRGGSRTVALGERHHLTVPCMTLLELVRQQRLASIDVLKIDVEGSEDRVLEPFFRDAERALWPRLMIIEDTSDVWAIPLFDLLAQAGYRERARTRLNAILALE